MNIKSKIIGITGIILFALGHGIVCAAPTHCKETKREPDRYCNMHGGCGGWEENKELSDQKFKKVADKVPCPDNPEKNRPIDAYGSHFKLESKESL